MIGTVLHFAKGESATSGSGVIRGEDGSRYRFDESDWSSPGAAIAGDAVDFDVKDGVATEIYVTSLMAVTENIALPSIIPNVETRLNVATVPSTDAKAIFDHSMSSVFSDSQFWARFQKPSSVLAAVLIVVSSFLPFISLPPIPIGGFEGGGMNLFTTVSKIWSLLSLAGPFVPTSLSVSLRFIALLLIIPAYLAVLVYREFRGTATDKQRLIGGLLALLGPLGIPMATLLLAAVAAGDNGEAFHDLVRSLSNGDGSIASNFFGFGMIIMMVNGGVLFFKSRSAVGTGFEWGALAFIVTSLAYAIGPRQLGSGYLLAINFVVIAWLLFTEPKLRALLLIVAFTTIVIIFTFILNIFSVAHDNWLLAVIISYLLLFLAKNRYIAFDKYFDRILNSFDNPESNDVFDGAACVLAAATSAPVNSANTTKNKASAKFCPECGTRNDATDAFCIACGTNLESMA